MKLDENGNPIEEEEEKEDGAAGDAGGTGEDAEDEGANTGSAEDTDDDDSEGAGKDKRDASGKGGKFVPKTRFDRVRQERNTYRAFGTPDEIKKRLEKAAEYERYEKELAEQDRRAADEAKRKAGQPTDDELNAAFDQALERRFGKGAAQDFEQFRHTQRRETQRHVKESLDYVSNYLTEHNIKVNDKVLQSWDRHLGTEFRLDPELAEQFRDPVTQKKALDVALDRVRAELIDPALAAVGASKLETARRRREAAPSSGGRGAQAPLIDENEEFTPPKNLTNPIQRQRWWDKVMARKRRELDEATPE